MIIGSLYGVLNMIIGEVQNRRREHDDIHARLVVGVHRLRVHQPLVFYAHPLVHRDNLVLV